MNLKQFFYIGYYHKSFTIIENKESKPRKFDFSKPIDKDCFKIIKKKNVPVIEAANKYITDFQFKPQYTHLFQIENSEGFELTTSYPGLTIGTGYNHDTNNEGEFKIGFYFDHTTGLPVIPGSSVKGTLRSVFPQLSYDHPLKPAAPNAIQNAKINYIASLFNVDNDKLKFVHELELVIFEGIDLIATNSNFNNGKEDIEYLNSYRRIYFHHAFISAPASDSKIFALDYITPHKEPLKNPVPLPFLKIKPNVIFKFQFIFPESIMSGVKSENVKNAFLKIINTIGIGAKTNVGYGQFSQTPFSLNQTESKADGLKEQDGKNKAPEILPSFNDKIKPNTELIAQVVSKKEKKARVLLNNQEHIYPITGNCPDDNDFVRVRVTLKKEKNNFIILSLNIYGLYKTP